VTNAFCPNITVFTTNLSLHLLTRDTPEISPMDDSITRHALGMTLLPHRHTESSMALVVDVNRMGLELQLRSIAVSSL
jgi:hypothetical protein